MNHNLHLYDRLQRDRLHDLHREAHDRRSLRLALVERGGLRHQLALALHALAERLEPQMAARGRHA